eukprot:s287_g10.t1
MTTVHRTTPSLRSAIDNFLRLLLSQQHIHGFAWIPWTGRQLYKAGLHVVPAPLTRAHAQVLELSSPLADLRLDLTFTAAPHLANRAAGMQVQKGLSNERT